MSRVHSNLQQIVTAFQHFLAIYDSDSWIKQANADDFKTYFKLGQFIEKTIETFERSLALAQFDLLLKELSRQKDYNFHDIEFFRKANDKLLQRVFTCQKVPELTLDLAVRIYTSFYPEERLKSFFEHILLTTNSVLAIKSLVNESLKDTSELEAVIVLNNWAKCNQNDLESEIRDYLSLYKVELHLSKLITILSFNSSDKYKSQQSLVLKCVLEKMSDRSVLTKNFWSTLFRVVNIGDIVAVCSKHKEFLESLCDFIEYIGSMISKNISEWKCSDFEINYLELVSLLKCIFKGNNVLGRYIDMRVKGDSNSVFWQYIEKELQSCASL